MEAPKHEPNKLCVSVALSSGALVAVSVVLLQHLSDWVWAPVCATVGLAGMYMMMTEIAQKVRWARYRSWVAREVEAWLEWMIHLPVVEGDELATHLQSTLLATHDARYNGESLKYLRAHASWAAELCVETGLSLDTLSELEIRLVARGWPGDFDALTTTVQAIRQDAARHNEDG